MKCSQALGHFLCVPKYGRSMRLAQDLYLRPNNGGHYQRNLSVTERIRFRIFRHNTNHLDVYNDDELHARYRFRSQEPFWIAEEISCDL